jgi:membrane-bound lytic murein transglycosylase D
LNALNPTAWASIPSNSSQVQRAKPRRPSFIPVDSQPSFDIPVTYNRKVQKWIKFYQTRGRRWLNKRIGRSYRYLPIMQHKLRERGLPQDLAYVAMIESGFSAKAVSTASAVGHWQFIKSTANRFGLQTKWWLDERRDPIKSTDAAANYLAQLYNIFGSWYLAASAYNMGEGRLKGLIEKYKTKNYWVLSRQKQFPRETRDYIPKLMAVMLIAKAPKLYGFKDIRREKPQTYDTVFVPGGFDLKNFAQFIRDGDGTISYLNPELVLGFVPKNVKSHQIRIPTGSLTKVGNYIRRFH